MRDQQMLERVREVAYVGASAIQSHGAEAVMQQMIDNSSDTSAVMEPKHPQVIRALRYIEEQLGNPDLSVASTAKFLGMNAHYLGSLFAKEVGQRMNRYITNQRVDVAKRLLVTTTWQIKRIAVEAGFPNAARFCHLFNTVTGTTPRQYRKQNGPSGSKPANAPL